MKPLDPRLLRRASATRGLVTTLVATGTADALLLVAQAFLIANVVTAAFLGSAGLAQVSSRLWALVGVSVGRAVAGWLSAVVAHRAGATAVSQLRLAVMQNLLARGPAYLDAQRPGDLVTLVTRGASALHEYFASYLPQLILAVVVPTLLGVAVLTQDPLSALLVAVTLPLIPLFMVLIGRYTQARVDRQWQSLGVLSGHFLDVVAGLPTLKLFGRAKAQIQTLRLVGEQYRAATMGVLRISFLSALVLELLATLSVAVLAVAIGLRLVAGTIDLRTGLAVLILAPEIYLPLRRVGAQFHAAAQGVGAAEQMLQILELPAAPAPVAPLPATLASCDLVVGELTVSYPARQVLRIPGCRVQAGRITALVGPSGCGKSTLLGVLMGLVGPPLAAVAGRISLESPEGERTDLSQVDSVAWRAQVGWVPQTPALLPGSVAENVRLGAPTASNAEVTQALQAAGLPPAELSRGLATQVGEGGQGLSVGQARRVGIARALVRQPAFLLCDEPTAALDSSTENDFLDTLHKLRAQGCTVLVVTHRPAVVALADVVIRIPRPQPAAAPTPPAAEQPRSQGRPGAELARAGQSRG